MLKKIFVLFFILLPLSSHAQEEAWILIDTEKLELQVKQSDITLVKFSNISIGRNGSGIKQKKGDDITPLGHYKISWINRKSRYHLFFGFNYPSIENAQQALEQGFIGNNNYQQIIRAHQYNQVPPQHTPLGGLIGLHGLGRGDKKIHETMNWTHGCIALTNEQINHLDKLIKIGTLVIVE
jgi:murein L,D-transpeptidase YafK